MLNWLFNQCFIIICALLLREINSVVESFPSFKLPPVEQELKIFPGTFMLWFPSNCYIMINTWLFTFPLEMTNKEYWDVSNNYCRVMIDYKGVSAWMIIYFHWKENLAQRSKREQKASPPWTSNESKVTTAAPGHHLVWYKVFCFSFFQKRYFSLSFLILDVFCPGLLFSTLLFWSFKGRNQHKSAKFEPNQFLIGLF